VTIATILMSKVVVATVIAGLSEVVQRRCVRPELAYAMWVSVFAVLIIPAVVAVPVPGWVAANLEANFETVISGWLATFSWERDAGSQFDGLTAAVSSDFVLGGFALGAVLLVWLLGGGFVLGRQLQGLRLLERLVRFAAPASPIVAGRCAAIARDLGIRRCPRVVTAAGAFSPFLWHPCYGPARIVLPCELLGHLSDEATDAVLRHELVHLRRNDAWRRRLEVVVLSLWWWLPTIWMARQRLRELEELCTDEAVLQSNPQGARSYARALLDTEEYLHRSQSRDWLVVSAFARRGSLKTRITRIVAHERVVRSSSRLVVRVSSLMLLSLGLLTAGTGPDKATPAHVLRTSGQAVRQPVQPRPAPAAQLPLAENRGLPDFNSVTVRNSDREIVLRWLQGDSPDEVRMIRLVRVSDDGVEPLLWKVAEQQGTAEDEKQVARRDLEWIFAFLSLNNEIIDGDGTRHSHPDLAQLSGLPETVGCYTAARRKCPVKSCVSA